jgi:predicted nucleic acid-binding Zn ribbon protein
MALEDPESFRNGTLHARHPMKEHKRALTPLKEIIASLMSDSRLPFNPEDALIWKVWDETVGAAVARNAQPLWIQKGRLRVKVSDPIWLQELSLAEIAMREKLNERLGRRAVEKIEFRLRSR